MLDVLINVWSEVAMMHAVKGEKGVQVTANRVGMECNKNDVLQ